MKKLAALKELINANVLNCVECRIYGVQAYNISGDEYEVIVKAEKINGRYYFVDRCDRRYLMCRYERAEFLAGEILDNLANAAEAVRLSVEQFRASGWVAVHHDITSDFEKMAEVEGLAPMYLGCGMVNDHVVNKYGPQLDGRKTIAPEPKNEVPEAEIAEAEEIIESAINFVEVDEVPTFEGSPVADKLRRMASITAKAVKTASKKAAAVLALVVCFAVGLGCMFFGCWACGLGLDAIEAQGAALPWLLRFALCVGCMFTIILDFCCWAELQIIRIFDALHAFDGFDGIYYRGEEKGLFIRPFSVIGTMISNIKNA